MKARISDTGQHPCHSQYVRLFVTPTIGPSSLLMWGRLIEDAMKEGEVDPARTAAEIGIGAGVGRTTFERLQYFRLVAVRGDELAVSTTARALSRVQVERLPERLRALHDAREWNAA